MKAHDAWTMEELWQQAQRNFCGHLAIMFNYLEDKGLSVDDFIKYTGEKTSPRWKSVITELGDMMNAILLNVLSNGEKIVDVKIGDTEAAATVTGLLRSDVMGYYGCDPEVSGSFWNKFTLLADEIALKFTWRKTENGEYYIHLTKK